MRVTLLHTKHLAQDPPVGLGTLLKAQNILSKITRKSITIHKKESQLKYIQVNTLAEILPMQESKEARSITRAKK